MVAPVSSSNLVVCMEQTWLEGEMEVLKTVMICCRFLHKLLAYFICFSIFPKA